MNVESPIFGWQERFPLPQSLDNPEFYTWAHRLDERSNSRLFNDLIVWGEQLGTHAEASEETRPLVDKLEGFMVELDTARPGEGYGWFPGLSPLHRIQLARAVGSVLYQRDPDRFHLLAQI